MQMQWRVLGGGSMCRQKKLGVGYLYMSDVFIAIIGARESHYYGYM